MKKWISGLVGVVGCFNLGCQMTMDEEVARLRDCHKEISQILGLQEGELYNFLETSDKVFAQVFIYKPKGAIKEVRTYSDENNDGDYDTRTLLNIGNLKLTPLPDDFDIEKYFPQENKPLPVSKTNGGLPLPEFRKYGSDKDGQII